MREIKFRVWDTENERMIIPYFFEPSSHSDTGYRYYEDWRDLEDGRSFPCHVMQYTGLKDKHGVEIYEADVIELPHWEPKRWVVDYSESNGAFYFRHKVEQPYDTCHPMRYLDRAFVIGNIYESPELLKDAA